MAESILISALGLISWTRSLRNFYTDVLASSFHSLTSAACCRPQHLCLLAYSFLLLNALDNIGAAIPWVDDALTWIFDPQVASVLVMKAYPYPS